MGEWSIVVHGGAKPIPPDRREAFRRGTAAAVAAGTAVLASGGTAVSAVHAAVVVLEADPTFNAGYGSVRNADGEVECDAGIMDGSTVNVGAVAGVRRVRHPVSVAARMLQETPVLLVAEGAERFAREMGEETCDPSELIPDVPTATEGDTVGCVAFDMSGSLAAATSTGGLEGTLPGRVGDSPLVGSGFYAENGVGAVALSGTGEAIVRCVSAARLLWGEPGAPAEAIARELARLARLGGEAGVILINKDGRIHWDHSSPQFAVAFADSTTPAQAFTQRTDTA